MLSVTLYELVRDKTGISPLFADGALRRAIRRAKVRSLDRLTQEQVENVVREIERVMLVHLREGEVRVRIKQIRQLLAWE